MVETSSIIATITKEQLEIKKQQPNQQVPKIKTEYLNQKIGKKKDPLVIYQMLSADFHAQGISSAISKSKEIFFMPSKTHFIQQKLGQPQNNTEESTSPIMWNVTKEHYKGSMKLDFASYVRCKNIESQQNTRIKQSQRSQRRQAVDLVGMNTIRNHSHQEQQLEKYLERSERSLDYFSHRIQREQQQNLVKISKQTVGGNGWIQVWNKQIGEQIKKNEEKNRKEELISRYQNTPKMLFSQLPVDQELNSIQSTSTKNGRHFQSSENLRFSNQSENDSNQQIEDNNSKIKLIKMFKIDHSNEKQPQIQEGILQNQLIYPQDTQFCETRFSEQPFLKQTARAQTGEAGTRKKISFGDCLSVAAKTADQFHNTAFPSRMKQEGSQEINLFQKQDNNNPITPFAVSSRKSSNNSYFRQQQNQNITTSQSTQLYPSTGSSTSALQSPHTPQRMQIPNRVQTTQPQLHQFQIGISSLPTSSPLQFSEDNQEKLQISQNRKQLLTAQPNSQKNLLFHKDSNGMERRFRSFKQIEKEEEKLMNLRFENNKISDDYQIKKRSFHISQRNPVRISSQQTSRVCLTEEEDKLMNSNRKKNQRTSKDIKQFQQTSNNYLSQQNISSFSQQKQQQIDQQQQKQSENKVQNSDDQSNTVLSRKNTPQQNRKVNTANTITPAVSVGSLIENNIALQVPKIELPSSQTSLMKISKDEDATNKSEKSSPLVQATKSQQFLKIQGLNGSSPRIQSPQKASKTTSPNQKQLKHSSSLSLTNLFSSNLSNPSGGLIRESSTSVTNIKGDKPDSSKLIPEKDILQPLLLLEEIPEQPQDLPSSIGGTTRNVAPRSPKKQQTRSSFNRAGKSPKKSVFLSGGQNSNLGSATPNPSGFGNNNRKGTVFIESFNHEAEIEAEDVKTLHELSFLIPDLVKSLNNEAYNDLSQDIRQFCTEDAGQFAFWFSQFIQYVCSSKQQPFMSAFKLCPTIYQGLLNLLLNQLALHEVENDAIELFKRQCENQQPIIMAKSLEERLGGEPLRRLIINQVVDYQKKHSVNSSYETKKREELVESHYQTILAILRCNQDNSIGSNSNNNIMIKQQLPLSKFKTEESRNEQSQLDQQLQGKYPQETAIKDYSQTNQLQQFYDASQYSAADVFEIKKAFYMVLKKHTRFYDQSFCFAFIEQIERSRFYFDKSISLYRLHDDDRFIHGLTEYLSHLQQLSRLQPKDRELLLQTIIDFVFSSKVTSESAKMTFKSLGISSSFISELQSNIGGNLRLENEYIDNIEYSLLFADKFIRLQWIYNDSNPIAELGDLEKFFVVFKKEVEIQNKKTGILEHCDHHATDNFCVLLRFYFSEYDVFNVKDTVSSITFMTDDQAQTLNFWLDCMKTVAPNAKMVHQFFSEMLFSKLKIELQKTKKNK